MSSAQKDPTAGFRSAILAAVAVGAAGVAVYTLAKACRGPNGEPRCPVTGATASSPTAGCPVGAPHGHGHGHGSAPHVAKPKSRAAARLSSALPFQPRPFSPAQLARCDGTHQDPLGLLHTAAVDQTLTPNASRVASLEEDLAATEAMVCISVRGVVFKVTPQFYGAGEPYSVYAGKDVTRCLAIGIVGDAEANLPWNNGSAKAFAAYYSSEKKSAAAKDDGDIAPLNAAKAAAAAADAEPNYDGEFTADEVRTLELWAAKYEKKYEIVGWFEPFAAQPAESEGARSVEEDSVCRTARDVLDFVAAKLDLTAPAPCTPGTAPATVRRSATAAEASGVAASEAPPAGVL